VGLGGFFFEFVLVRAVMLGVQLAGFGGVVGGVNGVAVSDVGVMRRRFGGVVFVVVGGVMVVPGGVFVVLGGQAMMLGDAVSGGGHCGASWSCEHLATMAKVRITKITHGSMSYE